MDTKQVGESVMTVDTIEEALAPFDIEGQLYKIATEQWGSTHAQAEDFSKLHRDKFSLVNGIAVHAATGKPIDDPEVLKYVSEAWPHLIPPPFEVPLADRAFLENDMTARSRLVREIGPGAALDVAKRYGHETLHSRAKGTRPTNLEAPAEDKPKVSHASNPFHKSNWNVTAQAKLLRAVGTEKCAAIARAVGSTIGATRPNPNF
jgi:hypothetical protein